MAITFFETPGAMKRFFNRRWTHQETFRTPATHLDEFVAGIVARLEPMQGGLVTLGEAAAAPRAFNALLTRHGIALPAYADARSLYDWTASAGGRGEVKEILPALLADAVEVLFVPSPAKFMVYARPDRLTSFFSNGRGSVIDVSRALSRLGFERLRDDRRER